MYFISYLFSILKLNYEILEGGLHSMQLLYRSREVCSSYIHISIIYQLQALVTENHQHPWWFTEPQVDIATYGLNQPRGRFSKNSLFIKRNPIYPLRMNSSMDQGYVLNVTIVALILFRRCTFLKFTLFCSAKYEVVVTVLSELPWHRRSLFLEGPEHLV